LTSPSSPGERGKLLYGLRADSLALSRAQFYHLLYKYTLHIGIPVSFSSKIEEHFEADDYTGVVLEGGIKHEADIVVVS
jgi:hypothetical protein